jgi:hypothetical protein
VRRPSAVRIAQFTAGRAKRLDGVECNEQNEQPCRERGAGRIEIAIQSLGGAPAGAPARTHRPDPAVLRVDGCSAP